MKILLVGLNHKTTPVDIRERLVFSSEQTHKALGILKNRFPDSEFVLISTCNRVELYSAVKYDSEVNERSLAEFLSDFHNFPLENFQDFLSGFG